MRTKFDWLCGMAVYHSIGWFTTCHFDLALLPQPQWIVLGWLWSGKPMLNYGTVFERTNASWFTMMLTSGASPLETMQWPMLWWYFQCWSGLENMKPRPSHTLMTWLLKSLHCSKNVDWDWGTRCPTRLAMRSRNLLALSNVAVTGRKSPRNGVSGFGLLYGFYVCTNFPVGLVITILNIWFKKDHIELNFIPTMTNDWFPMFATPVRIQSSMNSSWSMIRPWRTMVNFYLIVMFGYKKFIVEYGQQYLVVSTAVVLWSWYLSQTPKNIKT